MCWEQKFTKFVNFPCKYGKYNKHVLLKLFRLEGNPVCPNSSLSDSCTSFIANDTSFQSPGIIPDDCPGCPSPYEYAQGSPVRCFCAAPLIFGYRLKSPGFIDFQPYFNPFGEYLTSGLQIKSFQLNVESYEWQKGPRLGMSLKIYPVYTGNNSNTFNRSEVSRILDMFTRWNIPDSDIFGPYELIYFTLLEPYKDGLFSELLLKALAEFLYVDIIFFKACSMLRARYITFHGPILS